MKNKKYIIIGAVLIVILLIVLGLTFCSRQDEDSPDISPKGQKEHDMILDNEDLEEEYHVIDEYIEAEKDGDSKDDKKTSNGGNQTSNKNTTGNNQAGNAGVADDGESDETEDGEGDTGNDNAGNDENTGDNGEETPSTNLKPSEDKNGEWGDIKR